MGQFIEKSRTKRTFELCGRMILREQNLLVYINELGCFSLCHADLTILLTGLDSVTVLDENGRISAECTRSESGKGLEIISGEKIFSIPVALVKRVVSKAQRKGPVFERVSDDYSE
jgi:hypothetical protein